MDVLVLEPASPPPESGRSSPSPTASPEFEFWMVGKNPGSFPSPALLTADELFSGGIVLPLHTFQAPCPNTDEEADEDAEDEGEEGADDVKDKEPCEGEGEFPAQPLAESCSVAPPDLPTVTFKWKDIFKATGESKDRGGKKNERRVSSVSGSSELININIWPFSRSRSAGHSGSNTGAGAISKAKASNPSASNTTCAVAATASAPASSAAPAGRKVSSAPCSRSNSRGETSGPAAPTVAIAVAAEKAAAQAAGAVPATSMLRRWVPGGQGRAGPTANGIRLGRASPVWQLRRNKLQQAAAAAEQKRDSTATDKSNKAVPDVDVVITTSQADAGEDAETAASSAAAESVSAATTAPCRNNAACSDAGGEECIPPHGLFGLRRTFFSKKVY
ncbi:papilin-like [Lolium rigidum]|uniref:papilin-like n=1 Tax=Lolium rigidum TaxID=89674 RepID=UPI001F5C8C05|nr:papilin-like [Lolium rigidum]